ncbi:MAG: peptide chain release factor N(5)-glutamine methyltransferase [Muribaculaceae bacterium]|nr:peptide chain release factor N(5)-glutamine methyltransferase [Muribaculaceae bacterium]
MKDTLDKIRKSLTPYYDKGEIESFIKIIFEELLNYSTVDIILHKDNKLSDFMRAKIENVVQDLIKRRPIQYIFGETYFYGHRFKVTPDTLIPRPETEELIDFIVKQNKESDLRVLDIGTGSGCIAISLALALRFAQVDAIDISDKAIDVAKSNGERLHAKVNFINADILNYNDSHNENYNIIVSNPPYICDNEKINMDKNVLDYEPHSALFVPDSDPLLFYRAIADYGTKALNSKGWLYFEINSLYSKEVASMLSDKGYINIEIIKDIHSMPRFVIALKK